MIKKNSRKKKDDKLTFFLSRLILGESQLYVENNAENMCMGGVRNMDLFPE